MVLDVQDLKQQYARDVDMLRQAFEHTGDGKATLRRRTSLVDRLVIECWTRALATLPKSEEPPIVALIAQGGYGRRELFPFSDIDLIYVSADEQTANGIREAIQLTTQAMWDAGLRASPISGTLAECGRSDPNNLEGTIALLDRRFLTGDYGIWKQLSGEVLTNLILRECNTLAQHLAEMARARHGRFGNTIFHMEPNLKECPGGLRDYQLTHWLKMLAHIREHHEWPRVGLHAGYNNGTQDTDAAFEFLSSVRCFLHFRHGRDDNTLDWQSQHDAAAASVGLETRGTADPAYWMRTYYRHARSIYRRALLAMEELPPARASFYRSLRKRRTPIPNTPFILDQGRIDLAENAELNEADFILRVFSLMAIHGYRLTQNAEDHIIDALPVLSVQMPEGPYLWNNLREILLGPHAAAALRTMHALGVLEMLIPEFHGIDALVIRDSYHRYTVDEHTFLVIDNIHALRQPTHDWQKRFATLLPELDRLDLFLLACLLHDTGKARRTGEHTEQSVELADCLMARLDFDHEERDTVRKLIRNHLEMSLASRRDIYDQENIRTFAEKIGTPMHLKMLTLMTYADIKAVHPDALTPWKADHLWQLYMATANFMDRSVDEVRYHAAIDPTLLQRIRSLVSDEPELLKRFLEGLPQRYLQTRQPEQIRHDFLMARLLNQCPVQIELRTSRHLCELTVVAQDRQNLFADLVGVLSAWGMNIVKADAFANDEHVIIDTLHFTDPFRTLELNPTEVDRFQSSVLSILLQQDSVERLLKGRHHVAVAAAARVEVETRLEFDNVSSSHSTLLQVVAQDGPGLLRQVALALARHHCAIEVALIDTEGETAIDVFYLRHEGGKLSEQTSAELAADLKTSINELRWHELV